MTQLELDLPPVAGRHRNRALAHQRRTRAVELALTGMTYQQIADELGYANRGTVHRIVQEALHDNEASSIEELRALEVSRLDAVQSALWAKAQGGDITAAKVVLRVIHQRCALLGLYPPRVARTADPAKDDGPDVMYEFDAGGGLVPAPPDTGGIGSIR